MMPTYDDTHRNKGFLIEASQYNALKRVEF